MFSGNSVLPLTESITSANISQKDLEKSNANGVVFTLVLLFLLETAKLELVVAAPQEAWSFSSGYSAHLFMTELSPPSC